MKEIKCSAISDMTLEPHSVIIVIRDGKGYDQQYVKWAKIMDNRSEVRRAVLSKGEYHSQQNIHIWDIAPEVLVQIKSEWLDYLAHPKRKPPKPKPHTPPPLPADSPTFASHLPATALIALEKESQEDLISRMLNDLHLVRQMMDSNKGGEVVFDWACCDGCGNGIFLEDTFQFTIRFIRQAVNCGLACVFSDFSVKALITQWDSDIMGGECPFELPSTPPKTVDGILELEFDCDMLRTCPFQQLKRLGDLAYIKASDSLEAVMGAAEVHAMDSTVIFNLNPNIKLDPNMRNFNGLFTTEILSHSKKTVFVMSNAKGTVSWNPHFVPKDISSVCHAILTYPAISVLPPEPLRGKDGHILLSQIHLVETQRLGDQTRRPLSIESSKKMNELLTQTMGMDYAETFMNSCQTAESQEDIEGLVRQAESDVIQVSLCVRSATL